MRMRLLIIVIGGLCLADAGQASIIFRPGEKVKYVAPGEEEISGNAQQLFDKAQEAEKQGNMGRAIKVYTHLLRKYPKDALAPGATYRAAQLLEFEGDYMKGANTYRWLVERYPRSPNFDESIEGQFRIGEMYLSGKKIKLLGIPVGTSMDRAVEIFAEIVRTAPFGRYTARAQFDIGLARQKQSANDAAIQAYQAVIDKFPNDPIAADAQYQIGYIYNEVIQEQPGSAASAEAQKRIDQIRAKVGPTALQPAVAVTDLKKKQVVSRAPAGNSRPAFRNSDAEVAPLPPPEQDSNLPPPASLLPPTTTAPEPSPSPGSSPAPEAAATPEPSPSPDSAASPAP